MAGTLVQGRDAVPNDESLRSFPDHLSSLRGRRITMAYLEIIVCYCLENLRPSAQKADTSVLERSSPT
jgi:hypothetical protein